MSNEDITSLAGRHNDYFLNRLTIQVGLHEVLREIGSCENCNCVDIGADNAMVSYYLRRRGGKWSTVVSNAGELDLVRSVVGDNVTEITDSGLPFAKKSFDVVVVWNYLEKTISDEAFIEECHSILKNDGRLVLVVPNIKQMSVINTVRQVMGLTYQRRGWVRDGYTDARLFSILKHGFDVLQLRTYSKFFLELTDAIVQSISLRKYPDGKVTDEAGYRRLYAAAGPLYKISYQLDLLMFLSKGFYWIATAKRRTWRTRNAPVLVDGRSISEAVLFQSPR